MLSPINKIIYFLAILISLGSSFVKADDSEIYFKSNTNAGLPYVMLMLDYRPSVFSNYCSIDSDCADKLSERAYIFLCENKGGGDKKSCAAKFCGIVGSANCISSDISGYCSLFPFDAVNCP